MRGIALALLLWGCSPRQPDIPVLEHSPAQPNAKVQRTLIVVGRDEVKGSLPGPCESFVQDYTGLYPIIDTLPVITEDSIYIDTLLKEAGMKVIDYGWGNWQYGPRMINMKLALEACTCTVSKVYWLNDSLPDGHWNARITERVTCNVPDSLIPWWTDQ